MRQPPNRKERQMASGQGILKWAALTLLLAGQALAQQGPGRRGPQGPIEVGVIVTTEEDVPYTVTLPGRAIAYQQTGIRPQVGGEVLEISYDPGKPVKAGDVLFRLDPETLAAALTAA